MTTQPEALRLADSLEMSSNHGLRREAAAELRRLHAENETLKRTLAAPWPHEHEVLVLPPLRRLHAQRDALLKLLKDVLPVAEDASESLGRFCSDEGWAQEDMDRMDNVDGMLPLIRAAIKAVEENT